MASEMDDYDAVSLLMDRGAFLRNLRLMEQADEAERAAAALETAQNVGVDVLLDHNTLDFQSYLAHQAYYDDYKHVNYRYINYGPILPGSSEALIIEQDRTLGKGGFAWDASFILGQHVASEISSAEKVSSMIELGSGCGVAGLMLAKAFPNVKFSLTDLPIILPLLERNCKQVPNATAGVLDWGVPVPPTEKHDIILGADVVASIYDPSMLVRTIADLAHSNSWIFITVRDRLENTIQPFEDAMRRRFEFVERKPAHTSLRTPNVWVFVARGKFMQQ